MEQANRSRLVAGTMVVFVLAVMTGGSARAGTCPNELVEGDRDYWAQSPIMQEMWYRDMLAGFYGWKKGDWDGGWGWAKYNDVGGHRFEFCKMMSSGRLLISGFDDTYTLQGGWWASRLWSFIDPSSDVHPKLRVVSRHPNSLDVVYRYQSGELKRVEFSQQAWQIDWGVWQGNQTTNEFVTWSTDDPKTDYLLQSDPVLLSRTSSTLDVVARGRGRHLLHLHWEEGAGWSHTDATELTVRTVPIGTIDRYFIEGDPRAVSRSQSSLDAFAIDAFNHLIHYALEDQIWRAEDVTQQLGEDTPKMVSDPVVLRRSSQALDVVGRSVGGHLIHYAWTSGEGWMATDVTAAAGSTRKIEGDPAVVSPHEQVVLAYARSGDSLLMYALIPLFGWVELDLTKTDFAVEGSPVALERGDGEAHAFIRDINGQLIHAYFGSGGLVTEDLTAKAHGSAIVGAPVPMSANAQRLDVFALGPGNHLIQYFWTRELGWDHRDVHREGFDANATLITTDPVVALRGDETLHVFAGNANRLYDGTVQPDSNEVDEFHSVIGRTLNSWHTNEEYREWAAGSVHDFHYEPKDDDNADATAASSSEIQMKCSSFGRSTALRASIFVHEATHTNHYPNAHEDCPSDVDCEKCCDFWDFHTVRDPIARLTGAQLNHSAYQVSVEYLADVVEFFHDSLPLTVIDLAEETAVILLEERILNPPGWTLGEPRPVD